MQNISIGLIERLINILFAIIFNVLLISKVSKEDYATYGQVIYLIGVTTPWFLLGLSELYQKKIFNSNLLKEDEEFFQFVRITGLLVTAAILWKLENVLIAVIYIVGNYAYTQELNEFKTINEKNVRKVIVSKIIIAVTGNPARIAAVIFLESITAVILLTLVLQSAHMYLLGPLRWRMRVSVEGRWDIIKKGVRSLIFFYIMGNVSRIDYMTAYIKMSDVEYANYTVSIRGGELLQQMMSVLLIVYAREIYKANQTIAFRKRYIYLLLIYGFVYVAGWPLLDHLQKYFVADYSEAIDMYIYNIWRAPIGLLYSYFTIRIFAIGAVNTTLIIMIALGIAAYYILSSISDIKIFTNAYYTIMLLLTFTLYNIQRSLRSNAKQSN